ncbi:FKBP-type peptidyl-prolyl cis-trans isomerase N-terminal domain-containing protein [Enterobacter bugandensis]
MMKGPCFRRLLPMLLFLCSAGTARADDGVPVLLRFAEQYHSKPFSEIKSPETVNSVVPEGRVNRTSDDPANKGDGQALVRTLTARQEQLTRQQATIRQQRNQLEILKKALNQVQERLRKFEATERTSASEKSEVSNNRPGDFKPLLQLITQFRHAVGGTPDEKRAAVLLEETRAEKAQITAALASSQAQVQALNQRLEEQEMKGKKILVEEQGAHTKAVGDLKRQLNTLQERRKENDVLLAKLEEERRHLQEDVKHLRQRAEYVMSPKSLESPAERQTYAAGISLGQDILNLLNERKMWGLDVDNNTVLAGIIDTFTGQPQLARDELRAAQQESEKAANTAREKAMLAQIKKDGAFIDHFKKQKGTRQSPSGFWYRVEHVGDSPVDGNAIVEIVVKESLTDGTVIQDMDLSGKVLSQPLEAYPPLFREAIGYLRNHGSVTLVVPPELAYGEAGYPPRIPPSATMIYELRIEDIKAAAAE